jgi:hypothetical protein
MSLTAAIMVGGLTAAGALFTGSCLPTPIKKFLINNHVLVDMSMLFAMLWKFGHSEFGASSATIACILVTLGCELARRRMRKLS